MIRLVEQIATYDVGSLPSDLDSQAIVEGANTYLTVMPLLQPEAPESRHARAFEKTCVQGFLDKLNSGIDIPNYVQLRDMNTMFLDMISGIEKRGANYVRTGPLSLRSGSRIPEVEAIRRNASVIKRKSNEESIRIKVCLTGPYTLSTLFAPRDASLFLELGNVLSQLVTDTMFRSTHAQISLITLDEPVFGFLNDPLLDAGSEGRERLLEAWEGTCKNASSKGALTSFHLHNTSDQLFWSVEHLRIVEAHAEDPVYKHKTTKRRLEETDKQLKASICVTDFDRLILSYLSKNHIRTEQQLQEGLAEVWRNIRGGKTDPLLFLEDKETMEARLADVVSRFCEEHVPYAGPECGLRSFPSVNAALTCLSRLSQAVKDFENRDRMLLQNKAGLGQFS